MSGGELSTSNWVCFRSSRSFGLTDSIHPDEHTFEINRERAIDYLNTRENVYVFDGFAGWHPKYRIKVRIICARAYHALFMHNSMP